ncbi:hypothetical protein [Verrucomicrobium sp. BvORR034]|uniref:AbiJ-NTD4 domain-containing protein n=1 Tax=Verrucomicrobium sp. BvORR034 TaxID=1396418 RepID=UPI0006786862|nr:hypothetical protein [Verrucomicrobium sp. BvORR034]
MNTFSQRHGYVKTPDSPQLECLSDVLRRKVWNILKLHIWDDWSSGAWDYTTPKVQAIEELYLSIWYFLGWDLDSLSRYNRTPSKHIGYDTLKSLFLEGDWFRVLDLLEFVVLKWNPGREDLVGAVNRAFEQEFSAYRIIGGMIVPISDIVEVQTVESAMASSCPHSSTHIKTAAKLLALRPHPDFRNVIKESISAVETACRQRTGHSTLGEALKKIPLPSCLKEGFTKLYAWTCGPEGLRHALMEESTVTHAEAKFMLVTCSAFTNYLEEVLPKK